MLSFSPLAGTVLLPLLLLLLPSVHGAAIPSHDDHSHVARSPLPDRWFHDDDHAAHALFRRQASTPPSSFPQVGSPSWAAAYPAGTPDSNAMPQAWKDALSAAVQAGKIPNIPQATQSNPNASPTYPSGVNPSSPQVCSWTYGCRLNGTIYDAPPGVVGLSFDDGPLPPGDTLYTFLRQNQVKATHFFIGINILNNWNQFNTAFQTNQDDIAVHTWTHPHMTALSNADVVAQLGWTLQVIYNSTGGRLARYWRPPYGDTDLRVTAIAKEVFGLTTVIWNRDTGDWQLGLNGGPTPQGIQNNMQQWLSGSQNPGLVILEHELSAGSVQAFITAFPLFKQYNWNLKSLATIEGLTPYQNAPDDTSTPTLVPLTAGGNGGAGLIAAPTSSSTSTPPSPTSTPTSADASTASAAPASGAKQNGVAPGLRSSSLAGLLSLGLAVVSSLCLI